MTTVSEPLEKEIAEYMMEVGGLNTLSGNFHFDYLDLADSFDVTVEWLREHREKIEDYLSWDDILDLLGENNDEFDFMFTGNYACSFCSMCEHRCPEHCEGNCDIWCEGMGPGEVKRRIHV